MPNRPLSQNATTTPVRHPPGQAPLDGQRDIARLLGGDGRWRLFRDNNPHGLRLDTYSDRWTLTREFHVHINGTDGERWDMITEPSPVCVGGWDAQRCEYVARRLPTGHVIARGDTQYGVLARAARRCLPNARHHPPQGQ
ncbi:hypothetical protein ACGFI9_33485 [Micromonospora sp. NPDC048930]|uniref:hypothetical protein n=1 Tax=Micromonospora sp. NPDC048930 TaxID=3364261 RepID=UPI00371D04A9